MLHFVLQIAVVDDRFGDNVRVNSGAAEDEDKAPGGRHPVATA